MKLLTAPFFLFLSFFAQAQSWKPIGPGGGGWITTMTVVNDASNTVYVGCDVGGIYKSTDHGQSWTIKDNGLGIYFMHDIEPDPTNPNTLYLASRGGVYKTMDGGDSWTPKRNNFPPINDYAFSAPISDIAIDPNNHNTLYAGVGVPNTGYDLTSYHWQSTDIKGAIYKSTDGADTWSIIQNTGIDANAMIFSIIVSPYNSDIVYTATSAGVYKSIDAGAHWTASNTGLPHNLTMSLVMADANTLYVTLWAEPGSASWEGGVYKSTDGGSNWVAKNTGLPQVMGNESGLTTNYPDLVIDPNNPQILYVGNIPWTPNPGIFKTIDGGDNWTWVTREEDPDQNVNIGWITRHSISGVCLAIDPNESNRLYFGSSTHIFNTEDGGATWNQKYSEEISPGYWKGTGFETTVVQKVAIDPSNANNVYVGYWDMGFLKSTDGGNSFKRTFQGLDYEDNAFDIIVDPTTPQNIYAATGWWESNQGQVSLSTDYGETWTVISNGLPDAQIWSIALDKNSPTNNRTLYAASYGNGIYKTTDGGQNWTPINNGLGVNGNLQVRKITIDPNNSNILYAGAQALQTESNNTNATTLGGLFKSTDAGANWSRIDASLPQITVYDIQVDPSNSQIIYTAVISDYDHTQQIDYQGGVYKSSDGGSTWNLLNNGFGNPENLNITAIAINPNNSQTLYATTSDEPFHDISSGRGIFKSTDGGINWTAFNDGLGVLYYDALTIDPNNLSTLYAGSGGNGLYKGTDSDAPLAIELIDFSAYANERQEVNIKWLTNTETNTEYFNIERSKDGISWQNIFKINAAGNPNSLKTYSALDRLPLSGISYYRLKETEFGGHFSYSNPVSVNIHQSTIQVYPNPCHGSLTITSDFSKIGRLQIFDLLGHDLSEKITLRPTNQSSLNLDLSRLENGIYFLRHNQEYVKIILE